MTNETLIKMLTKKNIILVFILGKNVGIKFRKDEKIKKAEKYIQRNMIQIRSITEQEWNIATAK